jgi:hypothetical protein
MSTASADALFALHSPTAPPSVPDCWSWSALSSWRRCPRQWWLLRSRYPNVPTPYPQPLYAPAVEGMLLHKAVEDFSRHVARQVALGTTDFQQIRSSFPVRRVIQEELRTFLASKDHLRTDTSSLLARVSVDACVNAFRAIASDWKEVGFVSKGSTSATHQSMRQGAEVPLRAIDPRICGRIDYLRSNRLTDFKTGNPKDDDIEQVRFYALLVWVSTGSPLQELKIAYVRTNRVIVVPTPSLTELETLAAAIRTEIEAIESQLERGHAAARPSIENCRMCSVRQLCEEYWTSPETATLRLTADTSALGGEPQRLDLEARDLPTRTITGSYIGLSTVRDIGAVEVRIGPSHTLADDSDMPTSMRVLNAVVHSQSGRWSISVTSSSEVFWQV